VNLKQLWLQIKSECFFFSHPLSRIFFFFQLCQLMFDSVPFLMFSNYEHNMAICYYEYVIFQFFDLASNFWVFMVSIWMFCILVLKVKRFMVLELISHVVVFLCSLIITIIPIATKSVGPAGGYCWIAGYGFHKKLRLIFYGPTFLLLILMSILYTMSAVFMLRKQCLIYRQSGRRRRLTDYSSSIQLYSKMFILPLIFIITYIVALSRRIMQFIRGGENSPLFSVLLYLNAFFEFSMGFFVTLLFLISDLISFYVGYSRRENRTDMDIRTDNVEVDYEKWENDTESLSEEL